MYEIIPIAAGALLGLLAGSTRRNRATTLLVAAVAVIVGLFAATISGEIETSWGFVVFDVGQVLAAYFLASWLARTAQRKDGIRNPLA
jgi:membrane protein implicated in regulation of membrane protease activity